MRLFSKISVFVISMLFISVPFSALASQGKNQITPKKSAAIVHPIYKLKTSNKEIALTFDDGFSRKNVETALGFLKKANIKTTFFIPGKVLSLYPDLWNQAVKDGHHVCNHTQGHFTLTQFKDDSRVIKEIRGWETTAQKVLGKEYVKIMKDSFPYLRLPGGAGSNDKRILQLVANEGYIPVGWSKDTYSGVLRKYKITKKNEDHISSLVSNYIIDNVVQGDIVLQHFTYEDISQLDKTIQGLNKKGFSIVQIPDILLSTETAKGDQ